MSTGTGRYHWSNCAPSAKLFVINGFSVVFFLAAMLFPGKKTFYTLVVVVSILVFIEVVKKMRLIDAFRSLNIMLTGRVKTTMNVLKELAR